MTDGTIMKMYNEGVPVKNIIEEYVLMMGREIADREWGEKEKKKRIAEKYVKQVIINGLRDERKKKRCG